MLVQTHDVIDLQTLITVCHDYLFPKTMAKIDLLLTKHWHSNDTLLGVKEYI